MTLPQPLTVADYDAKSAERLVVPYLHGNPAPAGPLNHELALLIEGYYAHSGCPNVLRHDVRVRYPQATDQGDERYLGWNIVVGCDVHCAGRAACMAKATRDKLCSWPKLDEKLAEVYRSGVPTMVPNRLREPLRGNKLGPMLGAYMGDIMSSTVEFPFLDAALFMAGESNREITMLTSGATRLASFLAEHSRYRNSMHTLDNVIVATSVRNQHDFDIARAQLQHIKGARKQIWLYPMLGPIDVSALRPGDVEAVVVGLARYGKAVNLPKTKLAWFEQVITCLDHIGIPVRTQPAGTWVEVTLIHNTPNDIRLRVDNALAGRPIFTIGGEHKKIVAITGSGDMGLLIGNCIRLTHSKRLHTEDGSVFICLTKEERAEAQGVYDEIARQRRTA
jgi:protein gp37